MKFSGPEIVCCISKIRGAVLHHIYSQKAYPKLRHLRWNLIPLRHDFHALVHKKGMVYMAIEYPQVQYWLIANGWRLCPLMKKWVHDLPEGMDKAKDSTSEHDG